MNIQISKYINNNNEDNIDYDAIFNLLYNQNYYNKNIKNYNIKIIYDIIRYSEHFVESNNTYPILNNPLFNMYPVYYTSDKKYTSSYGIIHIDNIDINIYHDQPIILPLINKYKNNNFININYYEKIDKPVDLNKYMIIFDEKFSFKDMNLYDIYFYLLVVKFFIQTEFPKK